MQSARSVLSYVTCLAVPCFSTLSHKRHDFLKKKKEKSLRIKCVISFPLQICLKYFQFYKKMSEILSQVSIVLYVKCPFFLSYFNETWVFSTYFRRWLKYQVSWKSVNWEPSCSIQTERRIDRRSAWRNESFFAILRTRHAHVVVLNEKKVKVNQSRYRPEWPKGFQEVKVPRFHDNGTGCGKVVSLTHRPPLPPGNTPGTHFC